MKHLLLAVLVALCTPAYAEIYKWASISGHFHALNRYNFARHFQASF